MKIHTPRIYYDNQKTSRNKLDSILAEIYLEHGLDSYVTIRDYFGQYIEILSENWGYYESREWIHISNESGGRWLSEREICVKEKFLEYYESKLVAI